MNIRQLVDKMMDDREFYNQLKQDPAAALAEHNLTPEQIEILKKIEAPVIFITAFPECLLTGERPEPTYLIQKPFSRDTVRTTIGQALFFHKPTANLRSSSVRDEEMRIGRA